MTAILCWHDGQKGYMAADRRRTANETDIVTDSHDKIVRCDPWLLGSDGDGLASEILRFYAADIAKANSPMALRHVLKECLRAEDWHPRQVGDSDGVPTVGSCFLAVHVALGNFTIFRSLTVARQDRPCCIGSGGDVALGAFEALRQGMPIESAMRRAIQIAILHNNGCGGEPQVEVIG